MKNLIILTTGLIFALSSCGNNEGEPASDDSLTDVKLSVVATRTLIPDPEKEPSDPGGGEITPPDNYKENPVLFSGEDIKSFNLTSREIVFINESVADEIRKRIGVCDKLIFYLDDELLFNAYIYTPISSWLYLDLVLVKEDPKMFLYDSYPLNWTWDDARAKELRENIQNRKPAWDKFIKYLNDRDKIIG
jgi:hypothetical protein